MGGLFIIREKDGINCQAALLAQQHILPLPSWLMFSTPFWQKTCKFILDKAY